MLRSNRGEFFDGACGLYSWRWYKCRNPWVWATQSRRSACRSHHGASLSRSLSTGAGGSNARQASPLLRRCQPPPLLMQNKCKSSEQHPSGMNLATRATSLSGTGSDSVNVWPISCVATASICFDCKTKSDAACVHETVRKRCLGAQSTCLQKNISFTKTLNNGETPKRVKMMSNRSKGAPKRCRQNGGYI